jgi:hypothetical protein
VKNWYTASAKINKPVFLRCFSVFIIKKPNSLLLFDKTYTLKHLRTCILIISGDLEALDGCNLKSKSLNTQAAMAFVDLCRLCGTDTLNIVRNAIFEGEGRVKKYALKITECLTLQVSAYYVEFKFLSAPGVAF